jgi:mono/diheme cytochrome c family protein
MRAAWSLITLGTCVATSPLHAQAPPTPTSVLDTVYSEAQAERGEQVFMTVCIDCHLPEEFSDAGYLRSWEGQQVADLLEFIQDNMPEDNPGSLRKAAYVDVTAYILKLNGIPSGTRDLDGDLAGRALIELPS